MFFWSKGRVSDDPINIWSVLYEHHCVGFVCLGEFFCVPGVILLLILKCFRHLCFCLDERLKFYMDYGNPFLVFTLVCGSGSDGLLHLSAFCDLWWSLGELVLVFVTWNRKLRLVCDLVVVYCFFLLHNRIQVYDLVQLSIYDVNVFCFFGVIGLACLLIVFYI